MIDDHNAKRYDNYYNKLGLLRGKSEKCKEDRHLNHTIMRPYRMEATRSLLKST